MRLILLHNPSSGDEDHSRAELESFLGRDGHEVVYQSLDDDTWADVLMQEADVVAVAGGDGSVRKLFTAIGASSIAVMVLPTGSANNIARTLGFGAEDAARVLAGGPVARSPFDLWEVESAWGRSRCVESVGGGLFAEVLARAEALDADPSGTDKVEHGLRLLAETLEHAESHPWTLELDGEREHFELLGIEAMNVCELGANLPFAPGADPTDGQLDVVLVHAEDRPALSAYVGARLRGTPTPPLRLETRRCGRLVVERCPEVRLHVDDVLPAWDATTTSWVEIERAETRFEVFVPAREL